MRAGIGIAAAFAVALTGNATLGFELLFGSIVAWRLLYHPMLHKRALVAFLVCAP
jgi:hypothetical protein